MSRDARTWLALVGFLWAEGIAVGFALAFVFSGRAVEIGAAAFGLGLATFAVISLASKGQVP